MIEFKKLRKVYKSRKGGKCVALNDIDLKLPDTGLVFIIGKSGSGKSTLLNLLGGLDTITSGDIIADGNSLASFKKRDFENYRSSYIGFVFQHYYLLDELTVKQNIELAMGIVGERDNEKVEELLAKVGLEGCEGRYPKELSGGQQQRVAIARALAKNPKLILGDELTGNLDHNTSVDILNVLKEISKEKLVIVVSHNLDEADQFADRIIELHDGMILRDRVRVNTRQKDFAIKGRIAYLPYFRDLTSEEAKALERGLKSGQICDIVQNDDGFAMTTIVKNSDRRVELKRKRFIARNKLQYTGIFTLKRALSKLVTITIVTLMILCTSVFASIHKIGHSEIKYTKNEDYISLVKGGLENTGTGLFSSSYYRLLDDDIEKVERLSGEKVYKLTNAVVYATSGVSGGTGSSNRIDIRRNMKGFYLYETWGTLICDEEFLVKKYGDANGKLDVLVGDPYNATQPTLTIITDYVADSLMNIEPNLYKSYEDILKANKAIAVIKTHYKDENGNDIGYKEKYGEIIERYKNHPDDDYQDLYYELCRTPLFEEFLEELIYSLGVTYTFNENFIEDYATAANPFNQTLTIRNMTFEKNGVIYPSTNTTSAKIVGNSYYSNSGGTQFKPVNEGEIKMSYTLYNDIFKTAYTASNYDTEFVPHDVTIRVHDNNTENKITLSEKTYKIVGLQSSSGFHTTDEDYREYSQFRLRVFGLYVKNNANVDNVVAEMANHSMSVRDIGFEAVASVNKIMGVFVPLFKLIAIGLYIFIVIYLINHAMQTIKKNYFQIGVMRSFGAKNLDVGIIFVTGVVLTGIVISVLSVVFGPYIVQLYNSILVESFCLILNTYAFDLQIVNMPSWLPIVNSVAVVFITLASALISLLVIRNLKPIEIIRAKDNGGEVS